MPSSPPLPEYERPPVAEVVCGITFHSLDSFLAPHLGLLWEAFRDDYPAISEQPPLQQLVEVFEGPPRAQIQVSSMPPLPRTWFVSGDESKLIQVQRDRFLHNWKKVQPSDDYPRFTRVIEYFNDSFAVFQRFLSEENIGSLEPLQYELTYVNHLEKGEGWDSLEDIGDLFPDFAWRKGDGRFLPPAEGSRLHSTFLLPDRAGRLHVKIQHARRARDSAEIIVLDLTARGIGFAGSGLSMDDWFSMAREWIVRGFTDLTSTTMHELWGRTS
jgi:uncharacterized protein (TIGR04255 family)